MNVERFAALFPGNDRAHAEARMLHPAEGK